MANNAAMQRLKALLANQTLRTRAFGNAPPYSGRVLVLGVWWSDDAYKFFHLTLRPER